jgi:hypothetical protein
VPNVDKGAPCYKSYAFSKKEWDQMQLILDILKVRLIINALYTIISTDTPRQPTTNLQQQFSLETEPTVWCIYAGFEEIFSDWENKINDLKYVDVVDAIKIGHKTFLKYYVDTDQSNVAVISMGLNFHLLFVWISKS